MEGAIGQPLPGGNTSSVMRVGETVHRSTGRWTESVHALLRYLDRADVDGVPRVVGFAPDGREVLTYVPGTVPNDEPWPDYVWSGQTLEDVGKWLRRYHDEVRDYRPSESSRWWYRDGTLREGEIVCHNDLAPYNAVFVDGRLTGVIDWDIAGPAHPLWDLAFCAWSWVPLHRLELTRALGGPGEESQATRLAALCAAYGHEDSAGLLQTVIERVAASSDGIRSGVHAGDPMMEALAQRGHLADIEATLEYLQVRTVELRREIDGRWRGTAGVPAAPT